MDRFPFYFQHDAMQCGVACMRMVLEYFGRKCSMEELEQYCRPTSEGVSMLSICKAAENFGLNTVCGRYSVELLKNAPLPCILYWNQKHFVVLYCIKKNIKGERFFYVADPSKGKVRYSEKELTENWVSINKNGTEKGVAAFFEKNDSFEMNNNTYDRQSLRFLFCYMWQYRSYMAQIILGLFLGSLLQLALPFLTQAIVDIGISQKDISFIYLILSGQLILVLSSATVDFVRRWLLLHVNMRVNLSLVSDFFAKLLLLPMSFFETKQIGDIIQRINDYGRVREFLTERTLSILFSMITLVVFSSVLLFYDSIVFVTFMFFSAAYGVWISIFLKRRKILDYLYFEREAEMKNRTYHMISSMQEIKLQDCGNRRRWEWEDSQVSLFRVQTKSLRLMQMKEAGGLLINSAKNLIITVMAAQAVIEGEMTLGMMLSVQYIIGQLSSPVDQLMGVVYSLQDLTLSLERINEVLEKPEEDDGRCLSSFSNGMTGIKISELSFSYEKYSPRKTLKDINLNIEAGKVTAVVGMSGSGKTTLLKLILGYYPIEAGCIMINGRPLSDYQLKWWRSQCGVVMQDGVIFSESIARNIAIGDDKVDMKRIKEAARIAHIDDFIEGLPLKYNTIIGRDGKGLSMGQKQRVLIARAIYKNPRFLFLDEATNSLDANNEKSIANELSEFCKGRTVLIVAHRLSTVRNADNIVVMRQGQIVEQGIHKILVEQKGEYYRLVSNQLEI